MEVFSGILPQKYGTITSGPQKAPRCTEECQTKYRLLRYRSTRFCIAHPFTQSPEILCFAIPKSASSRWAICTPSNIMVPYVHSIQHPERHLDQFSDFCKAHGKASLYCIGTLCRELCKKSSAVAAMDDRGPNSVGCHSSV